LKEVVMINMPGTTQESHKNTCHNSIHAKIWSGLPYTSYKHYHLNQLGWSISQINLTHLKNKKNRPWILVRHVFVKPCIEIYTVSYTLVCTRSITFSIILPMAIQIAAKYHFPRDAYCCH
jgi:hypothetical protein